MGDHRLNVKISVTGSDGKEQKIDWWVNWDENAPSKIFNSVVVMANKAQLPVNPFLTEDR